MSTGKTKYRWWEYPLYVAVTVLFIVPGAVVTVLKLLNRLAHYLLAGAPPGPIGDHRGSSLHHCR